MSAEGLRPTTLLLDALGTLVFLEPPGPLLAAELRERFALAISDTEAERAIAAEIGFYREHLDEGRDRAGLERLRARSAEALRSALAQKASIAEIDNAALTSALIASLRFTAFADARPAIRDLRDAGLAVVVVSNWDISLHDVLERLGFTALVDGVITSAEAGFRKPAPEIFRSALSLAGADPTEAVHVGDSLGEDVLGARAAGIEAILLARDGRPRPPGVRTIGSLVELSRALI